MSQTRLPTFENGSFSRQSQNSNTRPLLNSASNTKSDSSNSRFLKSTPTNKASGVEKASPRTSAFKPYLSQNSVQESLVQVQQTSNFNKQNSKPVSRKGSQQKKPGTGVKPNLTITKSSPLISGATTPANKSCKPPQAI